MKLFYWMLNDDDPTPPNWYRFGEHEQWRMLCWLGRNFAHNLTWYVIGIHDKPYTETGRFIANNWNPFGGFNWNIKKLGWMRYPFISYKGKRFEWYIGWREGGAVGIAFRRRLT